MGGVGDFFFGSDEPDIEYAPTLTPGQSQLLNLLTGLLTKQMGKGVEAYPGQIAAGPSSLQKQMFGFLGGPGMGYLEDILGEFEPESARQYWETAVKAPAMKMWQEDIIPEILEPFAAQNAISSGAAPRAVARSGERLTTDLAGTLADILFRSEQAHKGWQAGAIPQAMNILGAGGTQRGIEAERLGEPYQKWLMSQPWASPWLNLLPAALRTPAFENIITPPKPGIMQSLLPAAGTAAGGYLYGK